LASHEISYNNKTFIINYEIKNQSKNKTIIFLHGWGSNKEVMKSAFENLFVDLKHLYIDMPGFGKSLTKEILTTKDYANIINQFLQSIHINKDIVVGHSFGGKVATLLNPNNLILLSSAGIVEQKPMIVKIKIKVFKILKALGFGKFYKFFATKDVKNMEKNMYETLKNVVDEDFSQIFANFKHKTYIFWGKDDKATSLISGKKIASLIKNSSFYEMQGDHYFFLKNAKEIEKIYSLYV